FMGVMVLLITSQLLMGRDSFWLPNWLVRRSVSRSKLDKALHLLRPPARWIDRGVRPRLCALTGPRGAWCIALTCTLLGLSMPPMEIVPFSVNVVGLILATFGLSLIGRDGLLALAAFILTGLLAAGLTWYALG
ncbi:MAG TPA: exopolysaccharide biosynthesis protein, partial [Noviherbaspirillum sp.]|nr:exopolysaccharide biosynthesis protein [Noviherbaspirillum sp.]